MERTELVNAHGNERLVIQSLKEDKSGYLSDVLNIQGLIDFNMSFTQEETPYAADNDPEFVVLRGNPKGEGKATLFGLSPEIWSRIYSAISGINGVWFGDDLPVKRFGISFDENVTIDGEDSINRYVIFNCRVTNLPELSTKTISNSDTGHHDMPLSLSAAPIFYIKENGTKGRAIFAVFNNKLHPAVFEMYKDTIIMPTEAIITGV